MSIICGRKSQAAFEYIILLGIFLSMSTLVILYSNNELKNYVERAELQDNIKTIIRSAEMVAAQGPGATKIIQLNMPQGISQAFASGNDVTLRIFSDEEFLSDIHFHSDVKIFGSFEPEKGVKQLVLTAQDNGYVSISPLASPNLMDHVIAYYNMDYRNTTHILDAAGKSPPGRINSSDCTATGALGKGCRMSLENQNIFVENFNLSYNELSYSVWIYPDTITNIYNAYRIIDHSWSGNCNLQTDGILTSHLSSTAQIGAIFCEYDETADALINGATMISFRQWHNLIVTYNDGGQMRTYIDGQLDGSFNNGLPLRKRSKTLLIGSAAPVTFNGTIDEVIFFDKALTADEARKLYNLGRNDQ